MKQKMVAIPYNTVTEMKAIRSVLAGFGYPIWHSFLCDDTMGGFRHVRIDRNDAHRGTYNAGASSFKLMTLQQFIEQENASTPEQLRKADVKAQIVSLQQQIETKQKALAALIETL